MVHGDVYNQGGGMDGSFEPVVVFIVSPKTDRHVGNLENAVEAWSTSRPIFLGGGHRLSRWCFSCPEYMMKWFNGHGAFFSAIKVWWGIPSQLIYLDIVCIYIYVYISRYFLYYGNFTVTFLEWYLGWAISSPLGPPFHWFLAWWIRRMRPEYTSGRMSDRMPDRMP